MRVIFAGLRLTVQLETRANPSFKPCDFCSNDQNRANAVSGGKTAEVLIGSVNHTKQFNVCSEHALQMVEGMLTASREIERL